MLLRELGSWFAHPQATVAPALEHTGGEKRRCFILGYEGVFVDAGAVSGFALGTQGYGAGFKEEAVAGLEDAGC